MKVLAVGDSVLWGQGLPEEQKFHVLAVRQIAEALELEPEQLELIFQAHSGAIIKKPSDEHIPDANIPFWQEVPFDLPSIIDQVRLGSYNTEDPEMDLVILNGGINDVDFRVIINPTGSNEDLEQRIRQHCYHDMLELLQETRRLYPRAVIVLTGYYPILSELSNLQILTVFVSVLSLKFGLLGPLLSPLVARRSVQRTRYFYQRQLSWLRRAVGQMHRSGDHRGPGILFAHPAFGPQNCVGGPQSFLFEPRKIQEKTWEQFLSNPLGNVHRLIAGDPMAEQRRVASASLLRDDLLRLITALVASIGHPNAEGARRYAEVVREKYLQHRRISFRSALSKLAGDDKKISIKKLAQKYGLASPTLSLHDLYQYFEIDSIDVTLTTRSSDRAGTDHHVFLRINPEREWRLNETIFEGDLYNDFEAGHTTTYTIDPTNGHPEKRLYLWELREISLILKISTPGLLTEPIGTWEPERVQVAINGYEILNRETHKTLHYLDNTWTAADFGE
ncbi:hypothetical protein [Flavilitoribacter nigricans]|uniref:SGNH hydrolase-type esterase domain-containing protein n=1 Tax=Flavilitoribacter nigricans (strain ATCC 23147 / DSM 23189 / NBRC 102662 / NCIMB 1420 / SS-2) TaxID=1122177 RepID=A0A2D0NEG4_FLAN2|nr:hypothetical protein [Flavilitoribacter nigricans]PHN06770.1 hypothetical protein CRP01_10790 [Flavilitoribacter nigricans DSM 23189 = NBRC 102662]